MESINDKIIILFDGVCNLCIKSVKFIIKNDSNDVFRLAAIQSPEGQEIIKNFSIDVKKIDSIILIKNKKIKFKSSAVLTALRYLNTLWKVLFIFYIIPYPIRDFFYTMIAKIRYNIFGKQKSCMLPSENLKSKFLSS